MPDSILVFVNDRGRQVPANATALAAVTAHDPELGRKLSAGEAYLTDARAIRLDPAAPVVAGAILRVVVSTRPVTPEDDTPGEDAQP
jgi:hypothetical protein